MLCICIPNMQFYWKNLSNIITDLNEINNLISLGLIMTKCNQFPILYPNWQTFTKFFLGIATFVLNLMKSGKER